MRPSEYTPELLERWRGELPGLEAALPSAKGNERGAIVSKVWIRKRDLGLIPSGETLQEFRSRYYADRKAAKLERYRQELPALREQLAKCGWKHGERENVKTKIAVREIALGIASPRKKKTPGEIHGGVLCWHMEHPDDLAPLCLEREPGDRHSPVGWKTTPSWRHVTCMDCLALRGTDADPLKGAALEEEAAAPCCGNCAHWVPANSQALGDRFYGVCTCRPGYRIATEAGASCSRWTEEEREEAAAGAVNTVNTANTMPAPPGAGKKKTKGRRA